MRMCPCFMPTGSAVTSEARFLDANKPLDEWTIIRPRENEVRDSQGVRCEGTAVMLEQQEKLLYRAVRYIVFKERLCAHSGDIFLPPRACISTLLQVEYSAEHRADHFFITLRDKAHPNSQLLVAPVANPSDTKVQCACGACGPVTHGIH